jgi:hypothetical protein
MEIVYIYYKTFFECLAIGNRKRIEAEASPRLLRDDGGELGGRV